MKEAMYFKKSALYRNIKGESVERDRHNFPYTYEPYVLWEKDYKKTDSAVYSDRLFQWDSKKAEEISKDIGLNLNSYSDKEPEKVEKWLRKYWNDENLVLTGIEEGCNVFNGYAYWIYYYRK